MAPEEPSHADSSSANKLLVYKIVSGVKGVGRRVGRLGNSVWMFGGE